MEEQVRIRGIIFDVDGTLYNSPEQLRRDIQEYWVVQVANHLHVSNKKAEAVFEEAKKKYKSSTAALVALKLGEIAYISKKADAFVTKTIKRYVKPDRKLVRLIKKLRAKYPLYTLRNGTLYGTKVILSLLGFENHRPPKRPGFGPFDILLPTSELGFTKPSSIVFQNALKRVGPPAEEILIIGDRVAVDLLPAKKLGMKTALVTWGEPPKDMTGVDAVMETIYDIEQLL